ncbi:mannitol dehydrogenase family protein [Criibacterium bergeronii]|uniref:Mannitol dehydrogenase family protein n=1 Tax=Criibacterium bergeronii TaxID=1871336 RepID=A0A552V377_9FIRM|nr:mannitol dehydrogenase family protein [Criibacterium bergeronii]TRW24916.1 mannitol dehydrogenase family protein [Criibacterium bergeronii]
MKLSLANLDELRKKVQCLDYDVEKLRKNSLQDPQWVAFGSGNIFRGYIARVIEDTIKYGFDRGISVVETFDEEIIDKIYTPYDNLSLSVTLDKDGDFSTRLICNLTEALKLSTDKKRIEEIFLNKNLKVASFTITEKGYSLKNGAGEYFPNVKSDFEKGPDFASHLMSITTAMLLKRYTSSKTPLTLLPLDNHSKNGDKLKSTILLIANTWKENGFVDADFISYLENDISYPNTMIDKITPRPADVIEKYLNEHGIEAIGHVVTGKNTFIAPYVNSETAEYLVIEDDFRNGSVPLAKAGVYVTDRKTVDKVDTMKLTTCLNPLHTALAVFGCLLGYKSISSEMKDEDLNKLVTKIGYDEGLPVVVDPKIIEPNAFLKEVLEIRLPNPYMPDTPQRIATDTSQKLSVRFGETIKKYVEKNKVQKLDLIPLVQAGWIRYLLEIDDEGNSFEMSPDPLKETLKEQVKNLKIGQEDVSSIESLLTNSTIFGVNLVEIDLADKVKKYLAQMLKGSGSVRKTIKAALEEK